MLSALVLGSMAPDYPYTFGAPWGREATHTLGSVFWFALPAGWVAYLGFQHALRRPAIFLLPAAIRMRLPLTPRVHGWLPVSVSLVVGALTHVAWDGFTHRSVYWAQLVPALSDLKLLGFLLWRYEVLQHGSTLLGAGALAVASARWLRRTPPTRAVGGSPEREGLRSHSRIAALALPGVVGVAVALAMSPPRDSFGSLITFLVHVVIAGMAAFILLLGCLSRILRDPPVGTEHS